MECGARPNRSDVRLSKAEEAEIERATRDYFDELAPKRPAKPQRSDYSSHQTADSLSDAQDNSVIPEHVEFLHLETNSKKLVYNGNEATEEFVETEYYKDLHCIDKQHHTTGTGFIKVENTNDNSFSFEPDSATGCACHASCKGNPATNDWIPAAADMVTLASDKPKRSDS